MSADLRYTVDVNTTGAVTGLQKLQDKVGTLSKAFTGLQGAIAGLAMGATIGKALQYADAISDISVATNIAVANILGFSHAVEQNGGTAEGAQKALGKFGITIGEAADGSDTAQNAFKKVGVTLNDLRNLSEKDLLRKTIYGLSQITDASKRAAAQNDVFGKSMRGVDMVGVQGAYAYATVESMKYAAAVKSAGDVQDKLGAAFNKFQLEILKAMKPLAEFLNNLKPEQIEKFIDAVIKIGGAAAGFAAVTKGAGILMSMITGLGGAFLALKTMSASGFALLESGAGLVAAAWLVVKSKFLTIGNLFKSMWQLLTIGWGGFASMFARIGTILEALGGTAGILRAIFMGLAASLAPFLLGFAKIAAVIAAVFAATYLLSKAAVELGKIFEVTWAVDWFEPFVNAVEGASDAFLRFIGLKGKKPEVVEGPKGRSYSAEDTKQMNLYVQGLADEKTKQREVIEATAAKVHAIQQASLAYADHNKQVLNVISFENSLIGKTAEETEVWRAQKTVFDVAGAAIKKLTDEKLAAQAALKPGETDLSNVYDAQIKKIRESAEADAARLGAAVTGNQSLKAIEKGRLQDIENITKAIEDQIARQQTLGGLLQGANDKKVDVAFEGAQAKRNPLEKQMASIQEEARKAALEAGRAFSAGFEGMDLSTAQAQELADGLAQIAQRYSDIRDAQLGNLDASRTWEAGWKDAFDAYVEHATNAATRAGETFNAITTTMNSAIDNFVDNGKFSFADFASSLIKDMIKIEMKALAMEGLKGLFGEKGSGGGLFSAIGSFFGGFFADGGQPPMNKPSLVGEKGPELFIPRSAGTIVPNGAAGGSQQVINNTNTTHNHYTVNAVDAKSVAQLFAENRKQLLGTVRMAQAEQPFASRI